jgi:hypothetical protein
LSLSKPQRGAVISPGLQPWGYEKPSLKSPNGAKSFYFVWDRGDTFIDVAPSGLNFISSSLTQRCTLC